MNRRSFIKLFGMSAAAASSAKTLASLEEAQKPIEIIQPKKDIILLDDLVLIPADTIRSIRVREDGNYSALGAPGVITKEIQAEIIFINPVSDLLAVGTTYLVDRAEYSLFQKQIEFDLPDLRGETYLVTEFTLNVAVNEPTLGNLTASRIIT